MSGMHELNVSAGLRTRGGAALKVRQTGAVLRPLLWVIGALAIMVALLLSFLTWGPNLMRETIAARTSRMLGRTVSVAHIDVSIFSGHAAFTDVRIDSLEAGHPMLSVKKLTLNINPWAYAHGAVVVRSIDLESPRARVVRVAPDRIDLSDVIDEFTKRPASLRRTDWQVDRVTIHDGSLDFDDRVVRKLTRIESLELSVEGLTNKENAATDPARLQAGFKLDGRPARIDAQATLFSESPQTKVHTRLDALPLASIRPYLTLPVSIQPTSGQITFDLTALYSPKADKASAALQIEGSVALNEPRIADASGAQRFAAQLLAVSIAPSFPLGGSVHLRQLQLASPQLDSGRDSTGALMWPSMATAKASGESSRAATPRQAAQAGGPSSLKIDSIILDAGAVRLLRQFPFPLLRSSHHELLPCDFASCRFGELVVRCSPCAVRCRPRIGRHRRDHQPHPPRDGRRADRQLFSWPSRLRCWGQRVDFGHSPERPVGLAVSVSWLFLDQVAAGTRLPHLLHRCRNGFVDGFERPRHVLVHVDNRWWYVSRYVSVLHGHHPVLRLSDGDEVPGAHSVVHRPLQ